MTDDKVTKNWPRILSLASNIKNGDFKIERKSEKREPEDMGTLINTEIDIKFETPEPKENEEVEIECEKNEQRLVQSDESPNFETRNRKVESNTCFQYWDTEINSVQCLLKNNPVPFEQKLLIKQQGRPTPDLNIDYESTSKTRTYKRIFNKNVYEKYEWICGYLLTNKLFCFVCLMFNKEVSAWTKYGFNDLKHLADRAKKHEQSPAHLNAYMDYNVLGNIDVCKQLDNAYLHRKLEHNKQVETNRHVLRRLITCIKFCGAFELALRGYDDEISFKNRGVYTDLINFGAELDSVLAIHINESKVFKNDSKNIQNDLLDVMLEVYREELIKEVKSANFLTLQVDEATEGMVFIIRYVISGRICERFWAFVKPSGYTVEILLDELQVILKSPSERSKLIAQSYNTTLVMSSKNMSVQSVVKETFPLAHFIHSYAHSLNSILERAAQSCTKIKIFFANLQAFPSFFSRSTKHTTILEEVVQRTLLRPSIVHTLFEHRDSFKKCLERILNDDNMDSTTLGEASVLLYFLNNSEFLYWLKFFHFITPFAEIFIVEVQKSGIESVEIINAFKQFEQQVIRIKSCTDNLQPEHEEEPARKRQKSTIPENTCSVIAKEVCDNILTQIKDRFDFTHHLSAEKLLCFENFKTYRQKFPQSYFDATVQYYPVFDNVKLKCELTALYEREDLCSIRSISSFLLFLFDNNLCKVFVETYKLADIICTIPMSTGESERCFSTLKRVKTFLKNTMSQGRLDVLAVLSVEKQFIESIPDFDNKVIELFCQKEMRKMDFTFK